MTPPSEKKKAAPGSFNRGRGLLYHHPLTASFRQSVPVLSDRRT
jgi:hypothetical protein